MVDLVISGAWYITCVVRDVWCVLIYMVWCIVSLSVLFGVVCVVLRVQGCSVCSVCGVLRGMLCMICVM